MSTTHKVKKNIIIFDFDGTVVESNLIKEKGFLELYKKENYTILKSIIKFHRSNMNLNRFEKFKYINENIIKIKYNKDIENELNERYSNYTVNKIKNIRLVEGALEFLIRNYNNYLIYLCSVTIETDLKEIVNHKNLSNYFLEIKGGPIKKDELIRDIIKKNKYELGDITYIGDSESDLQLAKEIKISFIGVKSLGSFLFPNKIKVVSDLRDLESLI